MTISKPVNSVALLWVEKLISNPSYPFPKPKENEDYPQTLATHIADLTDALTQKLNEFEDRELQLYFEGKFSN